jgi:diguanylate cyclase (GGDEF)-like protein/PAS domain S-box-containing protein
MQALWTTFTAWGGLVFALLAAAIFRSRRATPGAREMAAGLLVVSAWVLLSVSELYVPGRELYLLTLKAKYSAVALTPPLIALGVLAYTGRWRIGPLAWAAALAIPLATLAVTWTNDWHGWMWGHLPSGPGAERSSVLPWGPWFWRVHVPVSMLFGGFPFFVVVQELRQPTRLDRSRVWLLLGGLLLPIVSGLVFAAGIARPRFAVTPLALSVSGFVFAFGFTRRGLFGLAPVAYQAVFEHMRDGVIVVDADGRIAQINDAALAITRQRRDALLGARVVDTLPIDPRVLPLLGRAAGETASVESPDGAHFEVSISPIRDAQGSHGGRVILLRDVTERERALAALRQSEALVRGIVEHSPNGILQLRPRLDENGVLRDFDCAFANSAAAAQIGRPVDQLVGLPFKRAVHPHSAGLFQAFREALQSGERRQVDRAIERRGREVWVRFVAVPAGSDLIVTCVDVTDAKAREREMQAAATQDSLTGLLNRRGLEADAPSLLRDANGALRACAVLYLDLDRFKGINDEFGHEIGDLVLCEFAALMQRCTRGPDLLARVGGDEFVVLLFDTGIDGALWVAQRLMEGAREAVRVNELAVHCLPSIGVALHPEDGPDLKSLLQAADRAMYTAKTGRLGTAVASRAGGRQG